MAHLRMNHVAAAIAKTPRMTPIAMPALAPPDKDEEVLPFACDDEGDDGDDGDGDGLPPNGQ